MMDVVRAHNLLFRKKKDAKRIAVTLSTETVYSDFELTFPNGPLPVYRVSLKGEMNGTSVKLHEPSGTVTTLRSDINGVVEYDSGLFGPIITSRIEVTTQYNVNYTGFKMIIGVFADLDAPNQTVAVTRKS